LRDRVNGNPLFIISYCRALRDSDAVVADPSTGEARWSGPPPPLPLSLQGLLLAQVERAGKATQEALQRGAVLGASFPAWLLAGLCQGILRQEELDQALDEAARRSLIAPPPPAQVHLFSSQSLHDAIYATLSHAARQSWHRQAAEMLAGVDDAVRYERLEQIAYHYRLGDDVHNAAYYTRLAGDKARARQADEAALAFYGQTLAVAADGEEIAGEQRIAHEGIGDVRALQGEPEAASAAYQAALAGAGLGDEHRLTAKLALLSPLVEAPRQETLRMAQGLLPSTDPLQVWIAAAMCWLLAERGDVKAAESMCQTLPSAMQAEAVEFTQGMLEAARKGEPLIPYADLFALFAPTYLRPPPASSGGDS
jgi:hypothetical protein